MKISLMGRFGLLVVPLMALGAITYVLTSANLSKNSGELERLFLLGTEAHRASFFISEMGSQMKGVMLDPSNREAAAAKKSADENFNKSIKRMKELTNDAQLLKLIAEIGEFDEKQLNPAEDRVQGLIQDGKVDEARTVYLRNYTPLRELYGDLSTALVREAERKTHEAITASTEQLEASTKRIAIAMLAGLAVVSIIILLTTRWVVRVIKRISDSLADSAANTSSFSQQLTSASQQLSREATDSAGSLEESVASIEELSSMVKLNAENAKEAYNLAQTSQQAAERGESEMRRLNDAMVEISTSSKKIEEIINVIDDIAFQTNLLALNAAVEAARAGEQGKGFAVVAEAVRSLAARSASAAKDITSLIKESVVKIDRGSSIAGESGVALNGILVAVRKVSELNQQIASASQEQSSGITQISRAMNDLDQSTQRNAASAEEVAASSVQLASQAERLQNGVVNLIKLVDGHARVHHSVKSREVHDVKKSVQASGKPGSSPRKSLSLVRASTVPEGVKKPRPEDVIPLDDEPRSNVKTTAGF